ncbi:PaaI family thioesterase [Paraneptunicella aestuarii]|uniref:PaaI family thioesterase n=1 Tax=Paraneptunicella aestuarii TaxID=2831148 RepID=UPI001E44836B|nr:PaaI family thioesterase [Paraneptunicella aestuarii]UAA37480.1 PaaI family thioesterase [Paraneptunicella aestuarii]
MATMSEYAQRLSSSLIEHAYQRFCGIEIVEQRPGHCKTRFMVTENIDNLSHTLHGGVIYSMLDVTSMLATIPALEDGEYAITSSFSCSVMSATPLNTMVEMEADIVRNGRNMLFSHCEAYKLKEDGSRTLIASAQLTKFKRRQDV